MQDYDYERQADIDAELAEYDRRQEYLASLTDEKLREMGYKEHPEYPGYFENDPRHPAICAEDRYLMDHPGPPKVTSKQPPRRVRPVDRPDRWDDEQFNGGTLPGWNLVPRRRSYDPAKPIRSGEAERVIRDDDEAQDGQRKVGGLWICKVCRKNFALWPSERAWRGDLLGLRVTLVFRAPIACTNCRILDFSGMHRAIGDDIYWRRFWHRAITVWEDPTYSRRYRTYLRYRNRLLRAGASVLRLLRVRS